MAYSMYLASNEIGLLVLLLLVGKIDEGAQYESLPLLALQEPQ